MNSYLDNFKWFVPNTTTNNQMITQGGFEKKPNNESNSDYESNSDSENEYHKIDIDSKNIIININNHKSLGNLDTSQNYEKIYSELLEKEQIVRERLNSDTVEKIKENYTEYIDSDIQIIKEFALIMDSFVHIKEKLVSFEKNIKDFENHIQISKTTQHENNSELENKINRIDSKLNETLNMWEEINSTSEKMINKIVNLENAIKENDIHREEFIKRFEKFDKEHNEIKKNNIQMLNIFSDYQRFFVFSNFENYQYKWFQYIGIGVLTIGLGYRFGLYNVIFSKKR
jgi:hypothetical protein